MLFCVQVIGLELDRIWNYSENNSDRLISLVRKPSIIVEIGLDWPTGS
jgi:hypothetical protein